MRRTILVLALLDLPICVACASLLYFVLYLNRGPLDPLIVIVPSVLAYTLTIVLGSLGARHAQRFGLPDWGRMFSLLLLASIVGPILAPIVILAGDLADFNSNQPTTLAATSIIGYLLLLPPILTPAFALLYFARTSRVPASSLSA